MLACTPPAQVSGTPAHESLQRARAEGIHIFGAGAFARSVAAAARAHGVTVHAFLSSTQQPQEGWSGIPIRRVDASPRPRCPTWVGIFNREAHSDYSSLHRYLRMTLPEADIVWPQTFYPCLEKQLGWQYWLHPVDDYAAHRPEWERVRALLDDEDSRRCFDGILEFRRSAHADSPMPGSDMQYLPDWLQTHISAPLRMVDAGAFRGETVRAIGAKTAVEHAWTFEPDATNYAELIGYLAQWPVPVTHVPAGLSNCAHKAGFSAGLGESSRAEQGGDVQVAMVSLDDCLHLERINFLKLDVEGSELAALHGARATLLRERPLLAIAGYHRWDDLWRIPAFIRELDLDYRLRLRLHAHNTFDCVFYAY
ncbi:MAG: FkbM family methyltransferase [Pseudomonadota bacterium]|nr:FkbM family methyltransferase [Pseudomonadota bacterium]